MGPSYLDRQVYYEQMAHRIMENDTLNTCNPKTLPADRHSRGRLKGWRGTKRDLLPPCASCWLCIAVTLTLTSLFHSSRVRCAPSRGSSGSRVSIFQNWQNQSPPNPLREAAPASTMSAPQGLGFTGLWSSAASSSQSSVVQLCRAPHPSL